MHHIKQISINKNTKSFSSTNFLKTLETDQIIYPNKEKRILGTEIVCMYTMHPQSQKNQAFW